MIVPSEMVHTLLRFCKRTNLLEYGSTSKISSGLRYYFPHMYHVFVKSHIALYESSMESRDATAHGSLKRHTDSVKSLRVFEAIFSRMRWVEASPKNLAFIFKPSFLFLQQHHKYGLKHPYLAIHRYRKLQPPCLFFLDVFWC